jgi:hypothetical protein
MEQFAGVEIVLVMTGNMLKEARAEGLQFTRHPEISPMGEPPNVPMCLRLSTSLRSISLLLSLMLRQLPLASSLQIGFLYNGSNPR